MIGNSMKSKPSATSGETDSSASENEHRLVSRFWGVRYQLREVNRAVAFQQTSELMNVLTYRPVLTQVADGRPIIAVDPDYYKSCGRRYRLVFENQSDDAHPVHLHRHSFELTNVEGKRTSGIMKDTVVVCPTGHVEVDLVANNPGLTLFHCHQ